MGWEGNPRQKEEQEQRPCGEQVSRGAAGKAGGAAIPSMLFTVQKGRGLFHVQLSLWSRSGVNGSG